MSSSASVTSRASASAHKINRALRSYYRAVQAKPKALSKATGGRFLCGVNLVQNRRGQTHDTLHSFFIMARLSELCCCSAPNAVRTSRWCRNRRPSIRKFRTRSGRTPRQPAYLANHFRANLQAAFLEGSVDTNFGFKAYIARPQGPSNRSHRPDSRQQRPTTKASVKTITARPTKIVSVSTARAPEPSSSSSRSSNRTPIEPFSVREKHNEARTDVRPFASVRNCAQPVATNFRLLLG